MFAINLCCPKRCSPAKGSCQQARGIDSIAAIP
jgi:hypothetical protein